MNRLIVCRFIVISILACVIVGGGCRTNPTQPVRSSVPTINDATNPTPAGSSVGEKPISVTAEQLSKDYKSDKVNAAKKYTGKRLLVDGEIQSIIRHVVGEPNVLLKSGDVWNPVQCMFAASFHKQARTLTEGQWIKCSGTCYGLSGSITTMTDCEIVETGEDPAVYATAAEITKAFATDEDTATEKFVGKQVGLEGVVLELRETSSAHYLVLEGFDEDSPMPHRVAASYRGLDKEEFARLKKGQKVKVKGKCYIYADKEKEVRLSIPFADVIP